MDSGAAGLLFRHVVQSRLEKMFRRGERVLDLGCGDADDAVFLASRGVRVTGIEDLSTLALGEPGGLAGDARFDGAYSDGGALHPADLRAVGAALAAALRPEGPVLLRLRGPRPLPAVLRRALTGLGERRRDRMPGRGDVPRFPAAAEARRALGPSFVWTDAYALGVLVPGPEHEDWAREHPQTFGALAAMERAVRGVAGLRGWGEYCVLEGRRGPA
jgi:SAM-dependent methyltransferase